MGIVFGLTDIRESNWCKDKGYDGSYHNGHCYECNINVAGGKVCDKFAYKIPIQ